MILIIDTNRIIAALIKDSVSRAIILSGKIEFTTLVFGKKEVEKYNSEIVEKANVNQEEFELLLQKLLTHIKIIPDSGVQGRITEAKTIMDHIDPDDTPFIAAALAYNCGIW